MHEKLFEIFSGLKRAYGTYKLTGDQKDEKVKGKALTVKKPVTPELWEKHIKGEQGLGIVPINEDNKCHFGAIDIDVYNLDLVAIADKIEEHNWPLILCRSKSGGAHVFMFTSQPVPAGVLRAKLKEYAIAFGYPGVEIFPKQDMLADKSDCGNWINMPYFEGKRTTRYAIRKGKAITLPEFIKLVSITQLTYADLMALEPPAGEFSDAPPCLEKLIAEGFPKGSMNHGLFDMGVYARMKYPDDWQRWIHDYNERFFGPGTPKEVHQIIKSLDKKKYIYKCNEDPICGYCNKVACGQRKFGITSGASPYKTTAGEKQFRPCILDLVETPADCYLPPPDSSDEPYWVFKINGVSMDVSIDMVQSQLKFLREYLKKFRKVALCIDENRWMNAMNRILEEAEDHESAPDAGNEGQLWLHLENFCNGKVQARVKDELVLGKVWRDLNNDEKNGDRIYFRSPDFSKFLDRERFKVYKQRELYPILRRKGARYHKFMIKGKCVACWSVPPFDEQNEPLDVPEMTRGEY